MTMMIDERTMLFNAYVLADTFGHKWAEVLNPIELGKITSVARNIPEALSMIEGVVNLADPIDPDWVLSIVGIRRPKYNGVIHHRSGSGTVAWAIGPQKSIITVKNILMDDPDSGFTTKTKTDHGKMILRMEIGTKRPCTSIERIAFCGQNYVHDKALGAWVIDPIAKVETIRGDIRNEYIARKIMEVTNVLLTNGQRANAGLGV